MLKNSQKGDIMWRVWNHGSVGEKIERSTGSLIAFRFWEQHSTSQCPSRTRIFAPEEADADDIVQWGHEKLH